MKPDKAMQRVGASFGQTTDAVKRFGGTLPRLYKEIIWHRRFLVEKRDVWVGLYWTREETDYGEELHLYFAFLCLVFHVWRETVYHLVPQYDATINGKENDK